MAYGKKYEASFADVPLSGDTQSKIWRLDIYEEDYSGSVSEIEVTGNPIHLRREQADIFSPIMVTTLTVNVISRENFQHEDIFYSKEGDYMCVLVLEEDSDGTTPGTVYYRGTNLPANYTEPFVVPPYSSTIRFSDLALTAFTRYSDTGTEPDSLFNILWSALSATKLDVVHMREAINMYHNDADSTQPILQQVNTYQQTYRKVERVGNEQNEVNWSCKEVLEAILKPFGAVLFQWRDEWWIVRWGGWGQFQTLRTFLIHQNGSFNQIDVDDLKDISEYLHQDHRMDVKEEVDRVITEYTSDYDLLATIIDNPLFSTWTRMNDITGGNQNEPVNWSRSTFLSTRNILRFTKDTYEYSATYGGQVANDQNPAISHWDQYREDGTVHYVQQNDSRAALGFFAGDIANYGAPGIETYESFNDVSDKYVEQTKQFAISDSDHLEINCVMAGSIQAQNLDGKFANPPGGFGTLKVTNEGKEKYARDLSNMMFFTLFEIKLTNLSNNDEYWLHGEWRPNGSDGDDSFTFVALSWETSAGRLRVPFTKHRYWPRVFAIPYHDPITSQDFSEQIPTPNFPFSGPAEVRYRVYAPFSPTLKGFNENYGVHIKEHNQGIENWFWQEQEGTVNLKDLLGSDPVVWRDWGIHKFKPEYIAQDTYASHIKTASYDIDKDVQRTTVQLAHGDGPNPYAASSFRDTSDNLVTFNWYRFGESEGKDIQDLLVEQMGQVLERQNVVLSGTLLWDFDGWNSLTTKVPKEDSTTEINMVPLSLDIDLRMREARVTLMEMTSMDVLDGPFVINPSPTTSVGVVTPQTTAGDPYTNPTSGQVAQTVDLGNVTATTTSPEPVEVQANYPI